jgi:Ni/Co efflux regulator RcnB
MNKRQNWTGSALALVTAALLAASPALADKPEGKGKGKGHDKGAQVEHRQDGARSETVTLAPKAGVYFADKHRGHVHTYYGEEYRRGHCPPGLAKKNNGCMPPGQAKKWAIGKPLPREVVYYDLPPPLVVQIGAPPVGYRYVRAASDILLISISTGIVIDVILDLGRL